MRTSATFKRISLLCLLFFLASSAVLERTLEASPKPVVKVEPQAVFAEVGETFNVSIVIVGVQNLYGVGIVLYWDPSILSPINASPRFGVEDFPDGVLHKSIFPMANNFSQGLGRFVLAASSMKPAPPFDGDGRVAEITFKVTELKSCVLNLSADLASYPSTGKSLPIDHDTISGYFNRTPPTELDWRILPITIVVITVTAIVVPWVLYKRTKTKPDDKSKHSSGRAPKTKKTKQ